MFINHPGISRVDRIILYKIAVAHADIGEALITTRLFREKISDIRDDLYVPLQDSIVIAYSRPFTNNKPFKKLDPEWSQFDASEQRSLHEQLITLRDQVIAHSDANKRNVRVLPVNCTVIPDISPNKELCLDITSFRLSIDLFPKIEALCIFQGKRLEKRMYELLNNFYGKMNLPTYPFDLL